MCRPMIDFGHNFSTARQLNFATDASKNESLGFGGVFDNNWMFGQWEPGFIKKFNPSIGYLELFGLVAAILTWGGDKKLKNSRVILYRDNEAVVEMVNSLSSSCKNCMYLLRLVTFSNLINNRKIFVKHIRSADNYLSDSNYCTSNLICSGG